MYLLYRIKDNRRFAPELLVDGVYPTRKDANAAKKSGYGWGVKKVKAVA